MVGRADQPADKDPELVEIQVAQLILERAQSQCATCGKAGGSMGHNASISLDSIDVWPQQCIQCYQKCGRMEIEEDATNSVVIPVIMREPIAPVDAYRYCRPEDVLYNISHKWRKEVEKVCGFDTPRARKVAL